MGMIHNLVPPKSNKLNKYLWRPISLRPPLQITRHSFGQRSAFSRLRISKFVVHQAWRAGQIIPQKYYKNEIELDHNFVVYEAFQILTQQNKERREEQIHRFVENFERIRIEISNGVINSAISGQSGLLCIIP